MIKFLILFDLSCNFSTWVTFFDFVNTHFRKLAAIVSVWYIIIPNFIKIQSLTYHWNFWPLVTLRLFFWKVDAKSDILIYKFSTLRKISNLTPDRKFFIQIFYSHLSFWAIIWPNLINLWFLLNIFKTAKAWLNRVGAIKRHDLVNPGAGGGITFDAKALLSEIIKIPCKFRKFSFYPKSMIFYSLSTGVTHFQKF